MSAKKKKVENLKLETLGIEDDEKIEILEVEEPIKRAGGVKVDSVDELIDKLVNEAKV